MNNPLINKLKKKQSGLDENNRMIEVNQAQPMFVKNSRISPIIHWTKDALVEQEEDNLEHQVVHQSKRDNIPSQIIIPENKNHNRRYFQQSKLIQNPQNYQQKKTDIFGVLGNQVKQNKKMNKRRVFRLQEYNISDHLFILTFLNTMTKESVEVLIPKDNIKFEPQLDETYEVKGMNLIKVSPLVGITIANSIHLVSD